MSGIESFVADQKTEDGQGAILEGGNSKVEETEVDSDSEFDIGVFTQENPIFPKPVKRKSGSRSGSVKRRAKAKRAGNVFFCLLAFL